MTTTVEQVKQVATEFASADDSLIQTYIDIALQYVSSSYWGDAKFNFVHALMTAHIMKSIDATGSGSSGGGALSSERLGDISVSYAVASVSAADLSSTRYGALITQLSKSVLKTPMGY